MVACSGRAEFLLSLFLLAVVSSLTKVAAYTAPKPQFEALSKGGFRVYIPATEETRRFRFNANINEDLPKTKSGKITGETSTPVNGVLSLEFDNALGVGDIVNYRIQVDQGSLGYRREDLSWVVEKADLKDEYTPLGPSCRQSSTTVNGQTSCVGTLIFSDDFSGSSVDTSKWIIEHMIPTYKIPDFEFNSYENIASTRYIKNGILHLKPNALQQDRELRGTLDLTDGCTASEAGLCKHVQKSSFYIPPVKSGRVTSKVPFKYGKIEIRAKMPAGEWLYPIMELQMKEKAWGTLSPKVVIAYSRGNDVLQHNGKDIGSRMLYGGPVVSYVEQDHASRLITRVDSTPFHNDFHTYRLDWVPGKLSFYIDSNLYGEVVTSQGFPEIAHKSPAPFDREFVLSLGVAAGSVLNFPDGSTSGDHPKPWANPERNNVINFFEARETWLKTWNGDNSALQVDYVKVWAV